jgi:hypothetical protein
LIERTRRAVLAHFNAPPEEYAAIVPSMLPQSLLQTMLGTEFFRRTADGSENAAVSRRAKASRPE